MPRVPNSISSMTNLPESYRTATLFFVRSCGLHYLGPSQDPMFPADLEIEPGHWIDSSDTVRVLGCQEYKEVCDPTGTCFEAKAQWGRHAFGANTSESQAAILTLMALSLRSTISLAVVKLPELLADRVRTSILSLALDNTHWQAEMRRQFEITLARVQSSIIDIARGEHSEQTDFQRMWPAHTGESCPSIKIRTTGWRNLNLLELVCYSAFLLILWVSTIKYKDEVLIVLVYRRLKRFLVLFLCNLIE